MRRWPAALVVLMCTAACASSMTVGVIVSPTPAHAGASRSAAVTPSQAPTWDSSSPTFAFDAGSHIDMYAWDGKFVSSVDVWAPGMSHDGRYYITQDGQIWSAAGVLTGTDPKWGYSMGTWADDGDYLCTNDENTVWVTAVDGQTTAYPIVNGGNPIQLRGCSINSDRAAILEPVPNGAAMAVMALQSGEFISVVALSAQMQNVVVSADVRWMAESLTTGETDIIDLGNGAIRVRFTHATIDTFLPDGYVVALNDTAALTTRLVNWQTGAQLWTAPGHIRQNQLSDLATDEVLASVSTIAKPMGGDEYTYWILDSRGSATRFQPRP